MWLFSKLNCQKCCAGNNIDQQNGPQNGQQNGSQNGPQNGLETFQRKLVHWTIATSILVTTILTHVYSAPFLTYEPEMIGPNTNASDFKGIDPLKVTLWHDFDQDDAHNKHHQNQHHHYDHNKDDHFNEQNEQDHEHDQNDDQLSRQRRDHHTHEQEGKMFSNSEVFKGLIGIQGDFEPQRE